MSSFRKDIIITATSQVVLLVIALILNKLLGSVLTVEEFGVMSLARRSTSVLTFVIAAGMGIAIPRYLAFANSDSKQKEDKSYIMLSGIIIITVIGCLTYFVINIFELRILNIVFGESYKNSQVLYAMFSYAFSSAYLTYLYAYFRGNDRVYLFSFFQIIVNLFIMIALFFNTKIISILWIWSGISYLGCLVISTYIFISDRDLFILKINIKKLKQYIGEMLSYCLPRIAGEFLLFSFTLIPLIIINNKLDITNSSYFSVTTSLIAMFNPIFSFIGISLLSFVSKAYQKRQYEIIKIQIHKFIKLYLLVAIIIVGFVCLFSEILLSLLYSPIYVEAAKYLKIVSFTLIPNSMYLLLRNPIDAITTKPLNTYSLIFSTVFLLIMLFLSNTPFEFAITYVLSYGILGGSSIVFIKRLFKEMNIKEEVK